MTDERSENYKKLRQAIIEKKQVIADYNDRSYCKLCPHVIGTTANGEERVLCYQFGGETSRGRIITGNSYRNWRCLDVSKLAFFSIEDGKWWTWTRRQAVSDCITFIDTEVS